MFTVLEHEEFEMGEMAPLQGKDFALAVIQYKAGNKDSLPDDDDLDELPMRPINDDDKFDESAKQDLFIGGYPLETI